MAELSIRPGGAAEIADLFQLIKDLALFEKAPEEVITNEIELKQDFDSGRYEFLVAELKDEGIVGISLFYPRYSTWKGNCFYLEDLYVMPEYRGKGYGKMLLEATAEIAKKAGAKRLDWQVLDWNTPAVEFYQKIGAKVEKEWWNCKWWLSDKE